MFGLGSHDSSFSSLFGDETPRYVGSYFENVPEIINFFKKTRNMMEENSDNLCNEYLIKINQYC